MTAQQNLCLCNACLVDLPKILNSCSRCGNAFPIRTSKNSSKNATICGHCQTNELFVDSTLSLFQYKMPIDYLIKQIKFHNSLVIADLLGRLMANHILDLQKKQKAIKKSEQDSQHETPSRLQLPEVIIPIPLHFQRLRQRGYNQALEIAKPISKRLNIPIVTNQLVRKKHTRPQTDCSIKERKGNMHNSFIVQKPSQYKTVAIVDDVITTGATINEAAKVLKQQGVEQVFAWSCAHTNLSS